MSCFVWNETIDRNVVVFANDLELTLSVKNVYFYWNIFFSFTAMLLNGLLCIAIYWFPNPMIKINPMLLANSAFDFLFALTYLLFGRYIFVGYQRLLPTLFGLISVSNPIRVRYINFLITMFAILDSQVQVRGLRLFWFLVFCVLFGGLHFFSLLSKNSYNPSAEEIDNSIAIFRHYDFDITSGIYGKIVKPGLETTLYQKLPLIFTVSELLIILFCSVATRRILRQSAGMKIVATRRLNQSMDRMIMFMVFFECSVH
ncbi:hypothetical protein M3Y96_00985000 [Aphelenchoides besseyi]|nr:hypothetical protein M3Y96_00985000 [Aphelenchoides besseyi]